MRPADADQFTSLLASVFDAYSRPMPLEGTQVLWWNTLAEFSLADVRAALGRYVRFEKKFPPTPAEIGEMLGTGKGDQRPGADEAWAVALASRDEHETVVWTEEAAKAFAVCRPVLDAGDDVGARMAFKDTYNRLVGAARLTGQPPVWSASIGFDAARREQVLTKASAAGLLPAPTIAALLPPPDAEVKPTEAAAARAQLDRIRQMLAAAMKREPVAEDDKTPTFDGVRTADLKAAPARRVKEAIHACQ